MQTQNIEKEIFNLEKKYWQAMKDKDVQTMIDLSDDPCLVTGAQGVASLERSTLGKMMNSATYALKDFRLNDDYEVRVLNDDTAVIAYKVHEELELDGAPLSLDASEASTWIYRDGKWLCALHAESILGDPFGRDRRQPQSKNHF